MFEKFFESILARLCSNGTLLGGAGRWVAWARFSEKNSLAIWQAFRSLFELLWKRA